MKRHVSKMRLLLLYTQKLSVLILICSILFGDLGPVFNISISTVPKAEAANIPAIKVESFDQNVTSDGSTFLLNKDVGTTSAAFIKLNSGTRKSSAGPTGSTADTGPNIGTVGLVLTDTNEVTVHRVNATEVKVIGEVWRYEGAAGGGNEFVVRDRVAVSLSGSSQSTAISGITDIDRVVPFVTGYTVNDSSISSWNAATIAAHMDDSGNLVVSRNNSGTAATVYVDVVEFTGSEWTVCHGYSGAHDSAEETVTLNTDSDGQGGSTCDVGDWGTATIIEATMEGDSSETGLSDTLALVRPGGSTSNVVFDLLQDTGARNDGEAWIHVLQNDNMVVNRASNANLSEGNGSYGSATWPSGATTTAAANTLGLEWFTDTSGVGTAHMRGGLNARIADGSITYNDGDLVPSTDYDSTAEANFESEITFAASPAGIIYEAGGTGTGSLVGYNDSGDFVIRAGNGGSTAPADAARIVITPAEYDFSSRSGTLTWNFYPATESVDLSFDEGSNGSIDYSTSTTAASAWANWSGGDDGYVGNGSASIAGSEVTSVLDFNGTINGVQFIQGGSAYEVQHWIHRSGNNVGVEYGVIELGGLYSVTADLFVSATSTQTATTNAPSTNTYAGGGFVITENTSSRNVTSITITESGTIDGQTGLSNIKLYYDLDTTSADGYDCSSESYSGSETQFGSTDTNGFSGANGVSSFSDSVTVSPSQSMCVYVVYDIAASASDGQTIELSINNPTTDIVAAGSPDIGPASAVAIAGSTTVQNSELTQIHYHWREDDGTESSASSVDGTEDTPAGGFQAGTQRRLRFAVSAEGSANASPAQFRLQFAQKTGTCAASTGWEDVADVGGAWDIGDSNDLLFGDNTSNIVSSAFGAVSDEESSFNGIGTIADTGDKTLDIQINNNEFAEIEYTVVATVAATEGATYCFRLVDESPDVTHSYRLPLTIDAAQIDSTLTDFPVYVDLASLGSHFFANVNSDGGDIRVTTVDGSTEVPREVVSIDTGGKTGELHFKAPSISSTVDTTFYIYYGASTENEPQASSTYGYYNVWSPDFAAVYHLPTTEDSTGNGYTLSASNISTVTNARVGTEAADFNGSNSVYTNTALDTALGGLSGIAFSAWIQSDVTNSDKGYMIVPTINGSDQDFNMRYDASGANGGGTNLLKGSIDTSAGDMQYETANNTQTTSWQHVAHMWQSGQAIEVSLDGSATSFTSAPTSQSGTTVINSGTMYLGASGKDSASGGWDGRMDEVRFSDAYRSQSWMSAEFSNQNTPTTFYSTSTYETISGYPVAITYDVYPEANITSDIIVSALNSQVATLDVGATSQYVGGTFVIERPGADRTLTSITIAETGTVDAANDLDNIAIYYDISATDCTGETYNAGSDSQWGSTDTDGFSSANGTSTFTGSQVLNSTQTFCGYVVFDVGTGAAHGETINIEISNPSSDVVVTGSSVGPSSSISPVGNTTIAGPILTQTHYHWRNDNGDESDTGATSATGGSEDSAYLDVPKETTIRLRTQVSNEGTVSSQSINYRLEYGTKVLTCADIGVWQQVGVGSAFATSASAFIGDGNTTDIDDFGHGAMTEENTTFVGTGALKETTSESSAIALSSTEYTELEFAIEATDASGYETDYCFRVTDAGNDIVYDTYAELTTREKQDYFIQRGTETVSGTSLTLTAGVDYVAPASSSLAFVRITDTGMTGAGNGTTGAQDTTNNFTAYITSADDLQTSFTITRPATAAATTRVSWEIVEYVGLAGADNEMIVRDVGTVTYDTSLLFATGTAVANIADDADVVVFITGQVNPDTGTDNYNAGMSISHWATSTAQPVFERGDTDGVAAGISYAVVEFTGLNWKVQRVEHQYTGAGSAETESISVLGSLNRAFLHAQKLSGDELFNLDESGHQVWLSSIGFASFQLQSGATTPSDQRSVAWIIENTQTGTGAMSVYRSNGTIAAGAVQPTSNIYSIGGTVNTTNASLFVNNDSSGTGNYHPRAQLGATIASSTDYELWKADEGQSQSFRTEVIVWPVAELAFEQNYYQFYVDNDAITPTDPWPVGVADLGENTSVTGADDPLGESDRIRIRMSLNINNSTWPDNTLSFKLQYGRRAGASCNAISTWNDVGSPGSGVVWRGYDATPTDGALISATLISVSDVTATYEEENNSTVNPNFADIDDDVEYDWLVEHNGATQLSDYCFRMVLSDGSLLSAYNNYPTLRTTGYTPINGNWQWFTDTENLTPSTALAAENVSPTNIANEEELKLRVTATEVEGAPGNDIKFKLQYSEFADFSDGGFDLVASSSCTANSIWCYADGAGADNALIDANVLTDSDACSGGAGVGCGTHNEAATTTSTFDQPSLSSVEFEFTMKQAGARVNAVYYFRLYDVTNDVPVAASSTYPSLSIEGSSLSFTTTGLSAGTVSEGVTADVDTTPSSISFDSVPINTAYDAIYRLSVNTNATQGYQMLMYATQPMSNVYGEQIPAISGTNASPASWSSGCDPGGTGCFGYHAGDDALGDGIVTRFAADDTYAALSTTPQEVMFSSVPVNESSDIVYRIEITDQQPAGEYQAEIVYLVIPVF